MKGRRSRWGNLIGLGIAGCALSRIHRNIDKSDPIMNTPDILIKWHQRSICGFLYSPTGSAYTCEPPVVNTDEDWVCWAQDFDEFQNALIEDGYEPRSGEDAYGYVRTFRKDEVNIIVCLDFSYFEKWVAATKICKYLNIQDKYKRKNVHRICCGESVY